MKKIPVFYRTEQSSKDAASYSPSAGKPLMAVSDWISRSDIHPHIEVRSFEPATREQLKAAHAPGFVDGVLDGRVPNGFDNTSDGVARSLPYTTGSMIAATEHVLEHGGVAISPTSGFHHAGYVFAGGFCTFNGLIAAALNAKAKGLAERVLILDFDAHYGNGTQDIIDRLGLDWITHITAYRNYETRAECLKVLDQIDGLLMECKPDLVIYQAGADIHIDDPLGGILTTRDMAYRDEQVIESCLTRKVPLVWNLAGGYQRDAKGGIEPVLALHRQTVYTTIELTKEAA